MKEDRMNQDKNSRKENASAGSEAPRLAIGAAACAGLLRLIAVIPNFSPAGGLFLYSGARLQGPLSFALPLGLMLTTNFLLSLIRPDYPFMNGAILAVLAALSLNLLLGRLLRKTENPLAIGGAALAGSVQFFLTTNFAVWLTTPYYAKTMAGLADCYIKGLPFYQYTLLGDLVFTGVLFGAHHVLARRWFPNEAIPRPA